MTMRQALIGNVERVGRIEIHVQSFGQKNEGQEPAGRPNCRWKDNALKYAWKKYGRGGCSGFIRLGIGICDELFLS